MSCKRAPKYAGMVNGWLLFSTMLTLSLSAAAAGATKEGEAYLLFDVQIDQETGWIPTAVAFVSKDGRRSIVNLEQRVIGIAPGQYTLDTVFFGPQSWHTAKLGRKGRVSFNVEANTIEYLGSIEVQRNVPVGGRIRHKAMVNRDEALLKAACDSVPELVARLPLRVSVGLKEPKSYKLKCTT
ncbi:MAG: hypothetical protein AAF991_04735 [Pseudomonadota bacterium]